MIADKPIRAAWATPRRILLAGWVLFVIYAYPGFLSPDPVMQLGDARRGVWSDWHPPIMGWLWLGIEHVVTGTFGMLVAQSVALLLGLYGVARTILSPRRAACVAVAILLFPSVLTAMAVIWKDSQMAGYLMAGTACLLSAKRWVRIAGLALLGLATGVRYNGLAAVLPLVVLLFEWRPGTRAVIRYPLAVAAWLAITLGAGQMNRALTTDEMHVWYQGALHDITGTLRYSRSRSDAELESMLPGVLHVHSDIESAIHDDYVSWTNYNLTTGERRLYDFPRTDEQRATVLHAWLTLITTKRSAFLRHRYHVSLGILGLTDVPIIVPVWDGFPDNSNVATFPSIGIAMSHSRWQAAWIHALRAISSSALFRAYPYFFLAFLLLWLARRSRLDLALLLSGLCYEGTLFVAAVPDWRYSHWLVTCTVLVFARMMIVRYREGRDSRCAP
jgi:hypothetical protein